LGVKVTHKPVHACKFQFPRGCTHSRQA
jgi:hypothetical protein